MKTVAVVGGGLAGISAARTLKKAGIHPLVIEAGSGLGGRLQTLSGADWIADLAVGYTDLGHGPLKAILNEGGLATEIAGIQDAVAHRDPQPPHGIDRREFADNRIVLKRGLRSLGEAWQKQLEVLRPLRVGALRWQETRQTFLLRDQTTGGVLRHPVSGKPIEVHGVVVALPGPAARTLVAGSACCEPLLAHFQKMTYRPGAAAVFLTPAFDPGWCVLETPQDESFQWIALEERKGPGRAPAGTSVVVARLTASHAEALRKHEDERALEEIHARLGEHLPSLPGVTRERHLVRFAADVPAEGSRLAVTEAGVPTTPPGIPLALAGDYLSDGSLDATVATGIQAAHNVIKRLAAMR